MDKQQCVVCGKDLEERGDNFNWWWVCKNSDCSRYGLASAVTKSVQPKQEKP